MEDNTSLDEIEKIMVNAWNAFRVYRKSTISQRSHFMKTIANEIEAVGYSLIKMAALETNLSEARLKNELIRTIFQLNSYAEACERGDWIEARIDTASTQKNILKPDIRKMLIPLGPVVVFGASNFPFAYSTAGGDTACALAAGCPVIVKAHPAHVKTSQLVADAIKKAVILCQLPEAVFSHVYGKSFEVGKALIENVHTKAVAFTGSFEGGKQLFDWANQREQPIPVFAEMGSINPIFLLPDKMKQAAEDIARQCATSITLGMGQFCTNPGLIIGIDNEDLNTFITALAHEIKSVMPDTMLHSGIAKSFFDRREAALSQQNVHVVAVSEAVPTPQQGWPTIAITTADVFIKNPILHQEVFGPYSLIVKCKDVLQMLDVVRHLKGQLTATIIGTESDIQRNDDLISDIQDVCGRFILNGVPTGVEVCLSMQHGGPYPATTDCRFTSVGADGIKRFVRPIAFQNWPDHLLPEALRNDNPLGIWRTIDNNLSRNEVI